MRGAGGIAVEHIGKCWQQHQGQHHGQIFDNQPADGDLPALAVDQLPFFQGAQQYHGTGGGQTQAEHQAGNQIPAHQFGQPHPQHRRDGDLGNGPGDSDIFYCEEIFKREMETNTEHQQDHPNLREFRR
ncbi:hypothetical protein D3C80_1383710 [compost metagenome]